jgi:hypothetical protein
MNDVCSFINVVQDVNSKKLAGGQVALPNVRFMNVGYVNNKNGTLTVYVMWHET